MFLSNPLQIEAYIFYQEFFSFIYIIAVFSSLRHNGHVYEMFGNSKHYSVQPLQPYKPAEMTNKSLTAKYFIYDVVVWPLFYSFLALPLRFGKQYSPNLLQKLQFCLPYTLPLWFLQSVCKHLSR